MTFPMAKIGDLCELVNGKAFKPGDWSEDGEPIIRIQNLNDAAKRFNYWAGALDKQVIVRTKDVLLAWSGTPGTSFGAHIWNGPNGILNQHIFRVDLDDKKITKEWYVRAFNFRLNHLIALAHGGVGLKHVTRGMVDDLEIPLPSCSEQRRITAILDAADALRLTRRSALHLLDQLSQSMFVEMFGDLSLNDRGWRMAEVQDFVAGFESGKSLVADDEEDTTSKYRVLKVSAVTSLFYRPTESKPLPPAYVPPGSHFVRQGDLLFSRANTSQLIGATALVEHTPPNHVLPDKIWRFVWHCEPRADPYFVWHLFRQRRFRDAISSRATGTSGSMKNISQDKVLSIPIALPPLDLQQGFGRQLKATLSSRALAEAALHKQNVLFSSLQHRAFRGEL